MTIFFTNLLNGLSDPTIFIPIVSVRFRYFPERSYLKRNPLQNSSAIWWTDQTPFISATTGVSRLSIARVNFGHEEQRLFAAADMFWN